MDENVDVYSRKEDIHQHDFGGFDWICVVDQVWVCNYFPCHDVIWCGNVVEREKSFETNNITSSTAYMVGASVRIRKAEHSNNQYRHICGNSDLL